MPAAALKKLKLTAFRGSTGTFELDFESNKKLTLIYGENASGKTTICDAFEFLANDNVGSLDERGMGAGLEKYWPAVGKPATAVQVELHTAAAICSGVLLGKKAVVTPAAAKPRIELLRQRQILELVQAQPAKRYEKIKRFIDIAAFERAEETLRSLEKSLGTEKATALNAENENLAALQNFFEAAGEPAGLNAVSWAKQRLAQPTVNLDADIAALAKLRTATEALRGFPARLEERHAAANTASAALATAEAALAEALASATEDAGATLPLLQAGKAYLHDHSGASECPLCGSAENIAGLADAIDSKLAALAALSAAVSAKATKQSQLTIAQAALAQTQSELATSVETYASTLAGHAWREEVQKPSTQPPKDGPALTAWLEAAAAVVASWATVEAEWREAKTFLAALKLAVERYELNQNTRKELEALIPKVGQALNECVEERQKFIDGILTAIAQDVGKLYEAVHPGEGLDKIALPLDPARRASMALMAKFAGQDAPPQAYFSQSHLDTLGLCVFLALALRNQPADTILILDDVLGSVDEPHVERVIEMVYGVSTKFQHTIVTTHYRPWREKYRWGWVKPDQPCQFVELVNWEFSQGIRSTRTLPEVDRLKAILAASPVDTQAACGKAGVILEAALDHLTQKYECAVPRRPGGAYTLGDLLPSINGKLLSALNVEKRDGLTDPAAPPVAIIPLKPILEELSRIAQARNAMGAHFQTISFELLDSDAVGFATQVVALIDALVHPEHGWPTNDRSGSYWRNSGDSRRLHPLKKPS